MKTKLMPPTDLAEAIVCLKQGTPIAFPTETVYGLGASIFVLDSLKKIFTIKGRPADNPLIVHVSSIEQAVSLSEDLPETFFKLAHLFWPGPLTLVVKKNKTVSDLVSGGLASIAIRMPSNKIALSLIEAVGPIAAPSANISGRPSPTTALDVLEDLDGKIPLIIDGGECAIGIESTVLSLLGPRPVLLRPGLLDKKTLEEALGQMIDEPEKDAPIHSPGMKYRHYAPKAKISMKYSSQELKGPYILSINPTSGMRLLTEKTLYAELRRADRLGISEIEIDCSSALLNNQALMNRLLRAVQL